jgi:hypothetical protein
MVSRTRPPPRGRSRGRSRITLGTPTVWLCMTAMWKAMARQQLGARSARHCDSHESRSETCCSGGQCNPRLRNSRAEPHRGNVPWRSNSDLASRRVSSTSATPRRWSAHRVTRGSGGCRPLARRSPIPPSLVGTPTVLRIVGGRRRVLEPGEEVEWLAQIAVRDGGAMSCQVVYDDDYVIP